MLNFKRIFAVVIGLVFLFSGVVKLMDPVGNGLIVAEYFNWMHMEWLKAYSKYFGEFLALVEAFTGLFILSGILRREVAIFSQLLIIFFTIISAALAITNPDMECGCFGEIIHLTGLQTFLKNLVLLLMGIIAFNPAWNLGFASGLRYPALAITSAMLIGLAVYSWINVPVFEYTQYQLANTIVSEDDYFADDLGFTRDSQQALLTAWDMDGNDMSWAFTDGDVAVVSIYDPQILSESQLNGIARYVSSLWNSGFTPYILSTADLDIPGAECLFSDYKTIITLNRSNAGVTLLENGFIYDKRSADFRLSERELESLMSQDKTSFYVNNSTTKNVVFQSLAVLFFVVLVL